SDSGISGPLVYPTVTINGGPSARVMNGSGWQNEQTSGNNLFGTLDGAMTLSFTSPVSNLAMDVLNGTGGSLFTVELYDSSNVLFSSISNALPDWPSAWHYTFGGGGISTAKILGNSDFALDTVSFDTTAAVPEPLTISLFSAGLVGAAAMRRRKKA
ncbi:MAG TPA: PEP-CTERM sorting domain-containing protein, partial [Rhizomicrobium sp.]|nr:PEP-CTERM sorting domain-containing protein [Rhizomicrobium sp.]